MEEGLFTTLLISNLMYLVIMNILSELESRKEREQSNGNGQEDLETTHQ